MSIKSIALALAIAFSSGVTAIAQTPTTTYTQGKFTGTAPDWSKITWDTLPAVQQPGFIKIPPNLISVFGYDPSRSWSAGQKSDSVVMLGDADDAFGMSNFSLKSINAIAPISKKLTLLDLGMMKWQTPASLVKAIPRLGNLSVNRVPVLAKIFGQRYGTISQAVSANPRIANQPLGKLDLSKYSIDSIPGLTETPLNKFKSWQQSYINQVPNLNQVPFNRMPSPIDSGLSVVGIASLVLGNAERGDAKVGADYFVSGSVVRGDRTVVKACDAGKECSYLELGDFVSNGGLYGKRWVSGASQQVRGGYGFLAAVNGGKEPTGRLVYGSGFKVVLTGVDEAKGTADFSIYFRVCARPPFMSKTCTPYFFGVPWIRVKENDLVIVGRGR